MKKSKCPVCSSTKVTKQVLDGYYVISCYNCGFVNKRKLDENGKIEENKI